MNRRPNFSFPAFILAIITLSSSWQVLRCQSIHEIPLEAFEGFKKDSFTLPGDSIVQPVYKYGIYDSKVTTTLDGVGKVYVHHVLYFQEEEYSYMEIYSRKPSSEFIEGIKRYGNFRMYEHRNFDGVTNYTGKPRIEFVYDLNSIIATIYPLTIFKISSGKEMEIAGELNDNNTVKLNITDCRKYIDTILYDSLYPHIYGKDCYFSGWIQYDLEMDLIKVDLYLGVGEEFVLGTFESVIYDSQGNLVGHINAFGPLSFLNLTANRQFVYTNTGGAVSEDYIAPYVFRIFDLHSGEIIFSRRSTTSELRGFSIPNSDLGAYIVSKPFGGEYSEMESYIIDHDKGLMYLLHLNSLCQPPTHTTFFPTYCECYMQNGLKSKIFYNELTAIKFN